jgi:putative zinc finger/helix-turn-helix YgiT family protein
MFTLPDDSLLREKKHPAADQPFPWRCPQCSQEKVVSTQIDYTCEINYDGRLVTVTTYGLEIPICSNCGEEVFTEKVDDQINVALRSQLQILTPEQIREGISKLGLSRKEVADRLGVAEELLWRWAHGFSIQSRAMDNLLRLFLQFPEVRTALSAPAIETGLDITHTPNVMS